MKKTHHQAENKRPVPYKYTCHSKNQSCAPPVKLQGQWDPSGDWGDEARVHVDPALDLCVVWSSCILTPQHSLTGPVGQPLLPAWGAAVRAPGVQRNFWDWDSPVSAVSLHWWSWPDPWSPATVGPLTLVTGCFSHPSCPSSILTAGHRLMRHTARIP
jgi:hypothetical protein